MFVKEHTVLKAPVAQLGNAVPLSHLAILRIWNGVSLKSSSEPERLVLTELEPTPV